MKFGVCAGIDALPTAAEAGCDYLEMGFATVAALPDEAFREVLDKVEASPIRVEAMNGFLPGTMRLTGPEADHEQPLPFITKGFSRAKALGAQVVVFGSGGARSVPEGFPMEAAKEQMAAFARKAAACAREAGIRLALEPLSRHECNFLHTVKEGLEIYHMAGEPEGLCVLADLYHMASNGEDFSGILEARSGRRTVPGLLCCAACHWLYRTDQPGRALRGYAPGACALGGLSAESGVTASPFSWSDSKAKPP